jgi:hypothetical protein
LANSHFVGLVLATDGRPPARAIGRRIAPDLASSPNDGNLRLSVPVSNDALPDPPARPVYLSLRAPVFSTIQSPIAFSTSGAMVVSILAYSPGEPVLQGWNR